MKNLLILCPNKNDATSFWRAHGPLSYLRTTVSDWDFKIIYEVDWSDIVWADCVFFQRPYQQDHRSLVDLIKSFGKKLWLDYDDLLFSVPRPNPAFKVYMREDVQNHIKYMINQADIVTLSTKELAQAIAKETTKICRVVENAWPNHLIPFEPKKFTGKKRIVWRGSPTHDADIFSQMQSFQLIAEKFKDWEWFFVGEPPYHIEAMIPREKMTVFPILTIPNYYAFLKTLEASVFISPLFDCAFNSAKSNIVWQEATFAGAACLVPNHPNKWSEWDFEGMIPYNIKEPLGLYEAFSKSVKNQGFQKSYMDSYNAIRERRLIESINDKRKDILACI